MLIVVKYEVLEVIAMAMAMATVEEYSLNHQHYKRWSITSTDSREVEEIDADEQSSMY